MQSVLQSNVHIVGPRTDTHDPQCMNVFDDLTFWKAPSALHLRIIILQADLFACPTIGWQPVQGARSSWDGLRSPRILDRDKAVENGLDSEPVAECGFVHIKQVENHI